jgi:hypothetical protein
MPHQSPEESPSTEITLSHGVTERRSVGPQPNSHHMAETKLAASQWTGRVHWHYVCLVLTALNIAALVSVFVRYRGLRAVAASRLKCATSKLALRATVGTFSSAARLTEFSRVGSHRNVR